MRTYLALLTGLAILWSAPSRLDAALQLDLHSTVERDLATIVLRFTSSDGVVAGFQGLLPGYVGLEGEFLQDVALGSLPTPTTDLHDLSSGALDSRFLVASDQILSVVAPFESATSLGGVFTPLPVARASQLDLIRLVAPVGSVTNYNFLVSEAIGAGARETPFAGQIVWESDAAGAWTPKLAPTATMAPPVVESPPIIAPLPQPTPPPVAPPSTTPATPPTSVGVTMDMHSSIDGGYATLRFNFTASEGVIGGLAGLFPGHVAFRGNLAQERALGVAPTPTNDFGPPTAAPGDSRFLVTSQDILSAVTPFESTAEMGGAFTPMVHARAEQMDLVELVTPVGSEIEYNFAVAEAIGAGASETTFSGRLIWELDAAGALAPRLVPAPTQLPEPDPPSIPDPEPVEPEAPPFVPPPIAEPPTAEAPPAKAPIMEWPVFEAVTGIPVEFPMNNGWLPQPDLWQLVKDYPAIDWGIAAIDVTESSFEFIADGEFILLRHSIAPIVTFDDAPQRNASFADALETSFLSKRLAMLAGNSHAADADGLIPEPSGLALAVFAFAAAGRCRPPRRAAPRFNSRQSFGINSPRSRRSQ